MQIVQPKPSAIATYVSTDETITFMQKGKDKIVAHVKDIAGNIIADQVKVKIPERQKSFCTGFIGSATKIQQLLKNRHLRPTYDPALRKVQFQPISPKGKVWEMAAKLELPEDVEHWICRSDGRISYADEGNVFTWDWVNGKKTLDFECGTACTALVEMPDGTLVVGDKSGFVYFKDKEIRVSEAENISKIVPLSESCCFVEGEGGLCVLVDLGLGSITSCVEKVESWLVLGDGRIVILKDKKVNFFVYDQKSQKLCKEPFCFESIDAITPISDTRFAMLRKGERKAVLFDLKGKVKEIIFPKCAFSFYERESSKENGNLAWVGGIPVFDVTEKRDPRIGFYSKKSRDFSYIRAGKWGVQSILHLSDESIVFGTDSRGSAIHTVTGKQEIVFSAFLTDLIKNDVKIESMIELLDGSIILKSLNNVFVIRSKVENSQDASYATELASLAKKHRIEQLKLELKYHPQSLHFYEELALLYEDNKSKNSVYKMGFVSAIQSQHPYKARRFYEKARKLGANNEESYEFFRTYLTGTVYQSLQHQIKRDLFNLKEGKSKEAPSDESLLKKRELSGLSEDISSTTTTTTTTTVVNQEPVGGKKYKKRLFIGEGTFSYTEALVNKHEKYHPGLSASITATELEDINNAEVTRRVSSLKEKGVTILYEVDGTTIHEKFVGRRFQRIQWNCPFGNNGSQVEKEAFKSVMPAFFASCSKIQNVGDRIHVSLMQNGEYSKTRQAENPIVFGSFSNRYRLIRKRVFGSDREDGTSDRYGGYVHNMTGRTGSYSGGGVEREFVFEKMEGKATTLDEARKLMDTKKKEYKILVNGEDEDLKNCYFECSTDEDSSEYEDFSGEEDKV